MSLAPRKHLGIVDIEEDGLQLVLDLEWELVLEHQIGKEFVDVKLTLAMARMLFHSPYHVYHSAYNLLVHCELSYAVRLEDFKLEGHVSSQEKLVLVLNQYSKNLSIEEQVENRHEIRGTCL